MTDSIPIPEEAVCSECGLAMQFDGGHHPPPGAVYEPPCVNCADHPFAPEQATDTELLEILSGPYVVTERKFTEAEKRALDAPLITRYLPGQLPDTEGESRVEAPEELWAAHAGALLALVSTVEASVYARREEDIEAATSRLREARRRIEAAVADKARREERANTRAAISHVEGWLTRALAAEAARDQLAEAYKRVMDATVLWMRTIPNPDGPPDEKRMEAAAAWQVANREMQHALAATPTESGAVSVARSDGEVGE